MKVGGSRRDMLKRWKKRQLRRNTSILRLVWLIYHLLFYQMNKGSLFLVNNSCEIGYHGYE